MFLSWIILINSPSVGVREWSGGYASRVPRCIWHVSQGTLALRCMPRRGMSQTQRVPCGAHAPFQPISAAKCHPAENSSCVWFIVVSDGTLQCLLYSHPIFTHSVVRSNGRRDWCEAWCELRRCSTLYLTFPIFHFLYSVPLFYKNCFCLTQFWWVKTFWFYQSLKSTFCYIWFCS